MKGRKALMAEQKSATAGVKATSKLQPAIVLPDPPSGLDPLAAQEWQQVGRYLRLTRRVARIDAQALTFYATSYAA